LQADTPGFQAGALRLEAGHAFPAPDLPVAVGLAREAANVAEVHARLARDIRGLTWTVSDFAHATCLTRLVEAIGVAGRKGVRRHARDWRW